MLTFAMADKASMAGAVTVGDMIADMIHMFKDLDVSAEDILDGLLAGLKDAREEYCKENPDFDNTATIDAFRVILNQYSNIIKTARQAQQNQGA